MAVISVSGELGSEGDSIAKEVAQTLSYHFADKVVIGAVLSQYGFVEFGQYYDTPLGFWAHLSHEEDQRSRMVDMLNRVILALAHHGNIVLVSRIGFACLSGFSDVLNVRVEAPLAIRTQRVMEQRRIADPRQAETAVKESDQARMTFAKWYYGARWDRSDAFDLVINTGKVSTGLAARWLFEAATALEVDERGDGRTTEAIQVDPILASTISDALEHPVVYQA